MSRLPFALIAAITTLLFSVLGCSPAESEASLPEANEKNCNSEMVSKIANKAQRNKFIDLCARRNAYKPSPPKTW